MDSELTLDLMAFARTPNGFLTTMHDLVDEVAPLVEIVEVFLRREGRASDRPELPIRAALMQVASDILLRAAAGPLREPLWGPRDEAATLARILLLGMLDEGRPR